MKLGIYGLVDKEGVGYTLIFNKSVFKTKQKKKLMNKIFIIVL